ncbi:Fibronectin type III domain containing 3A [Desmophyllum pertusum]|uniref:Fibronectin type III domain containing 3A n=1 Tax=Desmophyllum pertusum TaxID=174260 RepID=A0A9W9YHM0_9CNID|nr:Fibronectin type III domain containing 3A [Desmophyllum pertusum]
MAKNAIGYGFPSNIVKVATKTADPGKPELFVWKESGCNITLTWTKPPSDDCPIRFYTVSYRQKEKRMGARSGVLINITDPTANQRVLMLNCTSTYEFRVKAWNELGGGYGGGYWTKMLLDCYAVPHYIVPVVTYPVD